MNDEEAVRDLLTRVSPPPSGSDDRVAEIGRRVRHTRLKNGTWVAAAVTMVLGLTLGMPLLRGAPAPVASIPDRGCPLGAQRWLQSDAPGPLVPEGASSVEYCTSTVDRSTTIGVLTSRVPEMVRALNALPPVAQSRPCTLAAAVNSDYLVLRYPDRDPVTVFLNRNCGTAEANGHRRDTMNAAPEATFVQLRRQQLAAELEAVAFPAPDCVATIAKQELERPILLQGPAYTDLWFEVATVCHYERSGDVWTRTQTVSKRDGLEPWRGLINSVFAAGPVGKCTSTTPPGDVYMVWLVDAAGDVHRLRFWTEPCEAVQLGSAFWLTPSDALVNQAKLTLG